MEDLKVRERIRERLTLPLPGAKAHELMMARVVPMPTVIPEDARPSAVLVTLLPDDDGLAVVLMKRTEDGRAHSGQISFPGGRQEAGDADLRATALREAQEEIGLLSSEVDIIGALTPLYIPVSNFQVYPFVGVISARFEYNLSRSEVAQVLEVPLARLFSAENKKSVTVVSPAAPDIRRSVQAYVPDEGTVIWGATAMILSELEAIFQDII